MLHLQDMVLTDDCGSLILKALGTFGNCQRSVISLGVPQHMHTINSSPLLSTKLFFTLTIIIGLLPIVFNGFNGVSTVWGPSFYTVISMCKHFGDIAHKVVFLCHFSNGILYIKDMHKLKNYNNVFNLLTL